MSLIHWGKRCRTVPPVHSRLLSSAGTAACLAVTLLVAGACVDDRSGGSDDGLGPTTTAGASDSSRRPDQDGPPWPGDDAPTETYDLGAGLVAELPEGWEVTPFGDPVEVSRDSGGGGSGGTGGCTSQAATVDAGEHLVELRLNATGCAGIDVTGQIGNGYHGSYVTLDDVPDPRDVADHQVEAGSLTTFSQDYFECTNECNDYEDHVALLELADPPDPEHPTVVLVDPRGQLSVDHLVALADAIHPE